MRPKSSRRFFYQGLFIRWELKLCHGIKKQKSKNKKKKDNNNKEPGKVYQIKFNIEKEKRIHHGRKLHKICSELLSMFC